MVANLWDVTDKDIDNFSKELLNLTLEIDNDSENDNESDKNNNDKNLMDVASAVSNARKVCKLRYLNGAAPICYGIPIQVLQEP